MAFPILNLWICTGFIHSDANKNFIHLTIMADYIFNEIFYKLFILKEMNERFFLLEKDHKLKRRLSDT